jgi:hypothetical protein
MWTATDRYLGPATVTGTDGDDLLLEGPSGGLRARLALAYPYRPEPGDVVLVVAEEEAYVIGVLEGRGLSRIAVPGDLEIEAGGAVRIRGGDRVDLNAPEVAVKASKLEFAADRLFTRCGDAYQWVRGMVQSIVGRSRTVAEDTVTVRANRIVEFAEDDVKIDAKQIHLG